MATGTIKGNLTTELSTPTASEYINTSGTDPSECKVVRYGNIVYLFGYLNFKSSASGTYRAHPVFTGLPKGYNVNYPMCGMVFLDGSSMQAAMLDIEPDGTMKVVVRGMAVNGKKGPFFATYVTPD